MEAAALSATFTLTLQLLPLSLQCRHIFLPRSLHFPTQLPLSHRPLNSFVRPSPAMLLPSESHLLPPLPFIPSLETSPLQGKNSAAHFVSLFVSFHSSLLAFLIFSLTISFPFHHTIGFWNYWKFTFPLLSSAANSHLSHLLVFLLPQTEKEDERL